jgi:hypothetical protein
LAPFLDLTSFMNKIKFYKKLALFLLLILPWTAWPQMTRIIGTVTDAGSNDPLPFVNIILKGTTIGTTSGFDGKYVIETKAASDSLLSSFIGYVRQAKKIQKGKFQEIDFALVSLNVQLKEVVITPGENPAETMLKKIISKKKYNDREKLDYYQYEAYTKIQIDANNIEKLKNRKIFKPFKFMFDNVDTSIVNGKIYLPIFLSEALSDIYYRKSPKTELEVIKAAQASGIKSESANQFFGNKLQNINIYDNFLNIIQKNFISPVANFGLLYYRYYLTDSSYIGNQWCYKIMFKPRRKQELTFTGHFWVNDTSWAIRKVEMKMVEDANINYINDMVVKQEYNRIDTSHWMLTHENLVADFNLIENSKKTLGFYGRRSCDYSKFVFEKPMTREFYASPTSIIVDEKAMDRTETYWAGARHDSLTRDEKTVYHMIDTLKTVPAFKTYYDIIKMLVTGYYVHKNFEWGPYSSIISFNTTEGTRFRLGGRTSNDWSDKLLLEYHLAYGTKDQQLKYGGGFMYMLGKNPRRDFGAYYKYDIEQLGQSLNAMREDYLIGTVFRKNPVNKLSMVQEYKGFYEHEWFNGFINRVNVIHRDVYTVGESRIRVFNPEMNTLVEKNALTTSEVRFDTRLAYKEKFVMGDFDRTSLGAKFPILSIQYTYGMPKVAGSDYEFTRLQLNLEHWFNFASFGWGKYVIEAGKIWGTLPYPLLKLHEGNETFSFDEYAFNTMNYYEFVSDRYVSAYYTHHFDGLFLNRIPLLRKLKWREVGWIKCLVGSLDDKNKDFNDLSGVNVNSLTRPYFEGGLGVENILKVVRIDGIWRLSYLDHPNITKFGIRFTLWFDF